MVTGTQRDALEGQWAGLHDDRVYLLEIHYDDVFDEPAEYVYRAWFDPFHFGAWRAFDPQAVDYHDGERRKQKAR